MLDETGMGPVIIEWEGAGVVYPVLVTDVDARNWITRRLSHLTPASAHARSTDAGKP